MNFKDQVETVYQRIASYVKKTPVVSSSYLNDKLGAKVFFKCENLQHTHSFKVRGAFSKITQIPDKKNKIAIASSGGNHGMAVAFAARTFNMPAVIVVPDFVPKFRIDKIKALGAEVVMDGKTMDDMNAKVGEFTKDPRYIYVHPFDDEDVIAGQGTVAYELLEQVSDLDVLVVSIGGGGLISGISQYAKAINPNIIVYGSQTIGADAMSQSLLAGKIVPIPAITSIAISLGATRVADRTFEIVKKYVDKVVTVTDEEAVRDLKELLDKDKLLVEPASSCNISALLSGKLPNIKDKKIGIVLCGGNFSLEQLKTYL